MYAGKECSKWQRIKVNQIWQEHKNNWEYALDKIAHLEEEKINVNDLEKILIEIFQKDNNILESNNNSLKSNLRRAIRIYDYLKYGKKSFLSRSIQQ